MVTIVIRAAIEALLCCTLPWMALRDGFLPDIMQGRGSFRTVCNGRTRLQCSLLCHNVPEKHLDRHVLTVCLLVPRPNKSRKPASRSPLGHINAPSTDFRQPGDSVALLGRCQATSLTYCCLWTEAACQSRATQGGRANGHIDAQGGNIGHRAAASIKQAKQSHTGRQG